MEPSSTITPERAPAAAPPTWFRANRGKQPRVKAERLKAEESRDQQSAAKSSEVKRNERKHSPAVIVVVDPVTVSSGTEETTEELSWWGDIKSFVRGPEGKGFGLSLLTHAVLLAFLSWFVIQQYQSQKENSPLLAGEVEEVSLIDEPIDTRADFLAGADQKLELMQPMMETTEESEMIIPEVNTDAFFQPESKGEGEAVSLEGLPFQKPEAGKIVTKGNFSAWTVPEDPRPFENYLIIVQVKLPKSLKKYERGDLSGEVFGTDGYWQNITVLDERHRRQLLPLQDGVAQLIIAVPGAFELVEDRIKIKSARLNEEQSLKIEF